VILRKAEGREYVGGIMLMIREDGALETFLVGDLRTDLDRAKQVADSGFQSLLDYQAGSSDDAKLPRRIRKEEILEQRHNPIVRTRRR
jgi:hypothetical protein